MLKTYLYTCNDCEFEWTDGRPEKYADVPTKWPCQKCHKKGNITFKIKPPEKVEKSKGPSVIRGTGIKTDDGFKDVLRKIKDNYPGSTIDV